MAVGINSFRNDTPPFKAIADGNNYRAIKLPHPIMALAILVRYPAVIPSTGAIVIAHIRTHIASTGALIPSILNKGKTTEEGIVLKALECLTRVI